MKLFLVRHGETEENLAGILMGQHQGILTEKGKAQAKETAGALKDYDFAHIYSSDLKRCVDTTEFIKQFHLTTPLTFTKELRERNLGVLQGQVTKNIDWESLPGKGDDKKPEGGESVSELKTRALNFIKEIYDLYPHNNVLVISHTGWISNALSHFTGEPSRELLKKVGHAQVFEIEVEDGLKGRVLNLQ